MQRRRADLPPAIEEVLKVEELEQALRKAPVWCSLRSHRPASCLREASAARPVKSLSELTTQIASRSLRCIRVHGGDHEGDVGGILACAFFEQSAANRDGHVGCRTSLQFLSGAGEIAIDAAKLASPSFAISRKMAGANLAPMLSASIRTARRCVRHQRLPWPTSLVGLTERDLRLIPAWYEQGRWTCFTLS